jgi:hypothetical protein
MAFEGKLDKDLENTCEGGIDAVGHVNTRLVELLGESDVFAPKISLTLS